MSDAIIGVSQFSSSDVGVLRTYQATNQNETANFTIHASEISYNDMSNGQNVNTFILSDNSEINSILDDLSEILTNPLYDVKSGNFNCTFKTESVPLDLSMGVRNSVASIERELYANAILYWSLRLFGSTYSDKHFSNNIYSFFVRQTSQSLTTIDAEPFIIRWPDKDEQSNFLSPAYKAQYPGGTPTVECYTSGAYTCPNSVTYNYNFSSMKDFSDSGWWKYTKLGFGLYGNYGGNVTPHVFITTDIPITMKIKIDVSVSYVQTYAT